MLTIEFDRYVGISSGELSLGIVRCKYIKENTNITYVG